MKDDYSGVLEGPHSEHFSSLVKTFHRRGLHFFWLSAVTLGGTLILVGFGVAVFLYPTSLSDIGSSQAKKLENEKEIDRLLSKIEALEISEQSARRSAVALAPFRELFGRLSELDVENPPSEIEAMRDVAKILNSIALDDELHLETRHVNDPYIHARPSAAITLDRAALDRIESIIEREVRGGVEALSRELQSVSVSLATSEVNQGTVDTAVSNLKWSTDALQKAIDHSQEAANALDDALKEKQSGMRAINRLVQETAELRALGVVESRASFFEAWLPIITIRVGAVLLLLFLTRVLLETYRYTVAISAFYRSRGDAVQFVQRSAEQGGIAPEEYSQFLIAISPDLQIDKVDSPERYLVSLARLGVAESSRIPPTPATSRNGGED